LSWREVRERGRGGYKRTEARPVYFDEDLAWTGFGDGDVFDGGGAVVSGPFLDSGALGLRETHCCLMLCFVVLSRMRRPRVDQIELGYNGVLGSESIELSCLLFNLLLTRCR
jgi:hypothetical protein